MDFFRRFLSAMGQVAHLVRHHRKTASRLIGTGHFNRGRLSGSCKIVHPR